MFLENKYSKAYFNIIQNAINAGRIKSNDVYYEEHHIIPRSVSSELISESTNLVLLTAKEHFVCHLLLTKCFHDKQHRIKMIWAFHRISFSKNNRMNKKLTSSEYSLARKIHSKNMKGDLHPSKTSPTWIPNMKKKIQESWDKDPKRKKTTSHKMKSVWNENYNIMKEHARLAGIKGSQISANKKRGKKFPGTGLYGANNGAAVHWIITTPENETINLYGTIKQFAKDKGLNCDMLIRNGQKLSGYKGYYVKNNGRVPEEKKGGVGK